MSEPTQASALLANIITTYNTGEREHRRHLLDVGRMSQDYVLLRKAEGIDRATAVAEIAAKLPQASRPIVNRMIGAFHVAALLGEGIDLTQLDIMSLRLCIPLLDRDRRTEAWSILPGIEQAAKELVRSLAEGKAPRDRPSIDAAVKGLLATQARSEAVYLAQLAENDRDLKKQADEALERAATFKEKAQKAAGRIGAEQQGSRGRSSGRAPALDGKPPIHNPVAAAKHSVPVDLAESLAAQIVANRDPQAVLYHLAARLRWSEGLAAAVVEGIASNPDGRTSQAAMLAMGVALQQELTEPEPRRHKSARVA